ncbi:MAG: MBL fold metallo-hydrolase [Clostridia bacterium]|nr:MBL fold metallo-hydrolase [Clostridia bacterium]
MAKICSLFSGSSGNCVYIENKDSAILIDAGVSAKRITDALLIHNLPIEKLKGIFVTHEHTDHIAGLRVFCSKNKIPVFTTSGTNKALEEKGVLNNKFDAHILEKETDVKDIGVTYFNTLHDANESCGFVCDLGNKKIAVCTDLGCVTDEVHVALDGCDTVLIESNHDVKMLQNNPVYSFDLKRRIMSDYGHISNNACAQEIERLVKSGSTKFILAHLSKENNLPMLASETVKSLLMMNGIYETKDYLLSVAKPSDNEIVII